MKEYISTAEGVEQMWNKINEVLDGFDFNRVAAAMETLDWKWMCTKEEAEEYEAAGCFVDWHDGYDDKHCSYRPEYPQLLATARKRIVDAIKGMPDDETHWSVSSGGFKVEVWINTDEEREKFHRGCKDYPPADDFKHAVEIALYFIAEEYTTF